MNKLVPFLLNPLNLSTLPKLYKAVAGIQVHHQLNTLVSSTTTQLNGLQIKPLSQIRNLDLFKALTLQISLKRLLGILLSVHEK